MAKSKFGVSVALILSLISIVLCEKFRYDDYSLYKISVQSDDERVTIKNLMNSNSGLDFWNEPSSLTGYVLVMSSPSDKQNLESYLNKHNLEFEITIRNVQEHIETETVSQYSRSNDSSLSWDMYYDLESINAWLDSVVAEFPDVASIIIGGESYQGRPIKGIKISYGRGRKIIFVEGGIHSREWIAVSTVNYIISQLLNSTDTEIRRTARDADWYIFPVTNPDGYIWSHSVQRLWRKNRRPLNANYTTFGVDLNRNWNHAFLEHGTSINPQSDMYAGPGPFSEPETRSLSAYIRSLASEIQIYLSFHSFSQMLLVPFGNTTNHLGNYADAVAIGRRAMGALSIRYDTRYVVGNIAETIYMATGGSIDWVKDQFDVPLVYCYELRDNGTYGFLLPVEQILPNNLEAMDSVVELVHQAKRFGYISVTDSGSNLKGSFLLTSVMALFYILYTQI